jgi:hypothetical protein
MYYPNIYNDLNARSLFLRTQMPGHSQSYQLCQTGNLSLPCPSIEGIMVPLTVELCWSN